MKTQEEIRAILKEERKAMLEEMVDLYVAGIQAMNPGRPIDPLEASNLLHDLIKYIFSIPPDTYYIFDEDDTRAMVEMAFDEAEKRGVSFPLVDETEEDMRSESPFWHIPTDVDDKKLN